MVPIHLYVEKRIAVEFLYLRIRSNIRLPSYLNSRQRQIESQKLLDWAQLQLRKKNIYKNQHQSNDYWTTKQIEIYGEVWNIDFKQMHKSKGVEAMLNEPEKCINIFGDLQSKSNYEINAISKNFL